MFHFDVLYLFVFIPVLLIVYSIFRPRQRKYVLLAFSLFLFWSISGRLIIYIILSSLSIFFIGKWMMKVKKNRNNEIESIKKIDKEQKKLIKEKYNKKEKRILLLGILLHVGLLVVLKYSAFLLTNINDLFDILRINMEFSIPELALPIGISFFTLEAVSYLTDLYHEKIEEEKNPFKLLLYLSCFLYLIEGPITRYDEVKDSLFSGEKLKYVNMSNGYMRILFGAFKKMIIADRLNIFIKTAFTSYSNLNGTIIMFASIYYTIQLYMEFSGTMDVAIGTGQMLGINLKENFRQPFFSKNISEFWTRWHITLGSFFKDYVFYPVSLSKPVKKLTSWGRKHFGNYYGPVIFGGIALFCVWALNGIWHGSAWNYIFFGMYHFVLIYLGSLVKPLINVICKKCHINQESKIYIGLQMLKTTCLVIIGELFFRAETLKDGINMFIKMFTGFKFKHMLNGSLLVLGLDVCDYLILFISIMLVLLVSIMHEKNKSARDLLSKQKLPVRWFIIIAFIMSIVIFGAYGPNYLPVEPIYAEF